MVRDIACVGNTSTKQKATQNKEHNNIHIHRNNSKEYRHALISYTLFQILMLLPFTASNKNEDVRN